MRSPFEGAVFQRNLGQIRMVDCKLGGNGELSGFQLGGLAKWALKHDMQRVEPRHKH